MQRKILTVRHFIWRDHAVLMNHSLTSSSAVVCLYGCHYHKRIWDRKSEAHTVATAHAMCVFFCIRCIYSGDLFSLPFRTQYQLWMLATDWKCSLLLYFFKRHVLFRLATKTDRNAFFMVRCAWCSHRVDSIRVLCGPIYFWIIFFWAAQCDVDDKNTLITLDKWQKKTGQIIQMGNSG